MTLSKERQRDAEGSAGKFHSKIALQKAQFLYFGEGIESTKTEGQSGGDSGLQRGLAVAREKSSPGLIMLS